MLYLGLLLSELSKLLIFWHFSECNSFMGQMYLKCLTLWIYLSIVSCAMRAKTFSVVYLKNVFLQEFWHVTRNFTIASHGQLKMWEFYVTS